MAQPHHVRINSFGQIFVVYLHAYDFTRRTGPSRWMVIQLDQEYNLMLNEGYITCFEDSLENVIEHYPELWARRFEQKESTELPFIELNAKIYTDRTTMGYFVYKRTAYTLTQSQLPNTKRPILNKRPSIPECHVQVPSDQMICAYNYVHGMYENVEVQVYSDEKSKMWFHVHEMKTKIL